MSRWLPAAALLLVGLYLVWQALTGEATQLMLGITALVLAWWISPLNGRRGPTHRDVTADPDAHPVVIYWRPGCIYCIRLRGALGKHATDVPWVSIWADKEAAAFVRSVNDGDETVPTVVIDGRPHTNPDPDLVRRALA